MASFAMPMRWSASSCRSMRVASLRTPATRMARERLEASSRAAEWRFGQATSSLRIATELLSFHWIDAAEVAKLAVALIEREEARLREIHEGVLVRPEIDETLRHLKIID